MIIQFIDKLPIRAYSIKVSSKLKSKCDILIRNFVSILIASKTVKTMLKLKIQNGLELVIDLSQLDRKFIKPFINRISQSLYSFNKYVTNTNATYNAKYVHIYAPQLSIKQKQNIVHMIDNASYTRDIINEPSNKSTPSVFVNNVRKMFKSHKNVSIRVLNEKDIRKQGLGLVDAIGNSSRNTPRFLIVDYHPNKKSQNTKTICLVGKGVTIDTGGYSMKSSNNMYNMHMDKTGASVCIGLIKALSSSSIKFKNRLVALCPLVENIVSDNSLKPSDIITAYNGQTVEIVSVDAEGRLILADALAYACKNYKPDYIFDFGTLTGWSSRLHCHTSYAYFTLNARLSKDVLIACRENGERCFRIPAWTDYAYFIKSSVADVKNYGFDCKNSDGFMASIFLMNFIPHEYRRRWVHFDIRLDSYNNDVNVADGFASFYDMIIGI